jgi:hypothetical protein
MNPINWDKEDFTDNCDWPQVDRDLDIILNSYTEPYDDILKIYEDSLVGVPVIGQDVVDSFTDTVEKLTLVLIASVLHEQFHLTKKIKLCIKTDYDITKKVIEDIFKYDEDEIKKSITILDIVLSNYNNTIQGFLDYKFKSDEEE